MTTGSEGTDDAADAVGQPEATDRTGQSDAVAATPSGNAAPVQPGLDSIPADLKETLRDLPPEQWPVHIRIYKSMQSQKDRAIGEARREVERLLPLARNGETLERISKHPKAKDLVWEAGRLAMQDPDAEVEDDAAFGEQLLADPDPAKFGRKFRTEVRREAQKIVEQVLSQKDAATRQADDAMSSAFADVQARSGLSPDQWASVAERAWKAEGGRAGFTPENVASKMLPYILDAVGLRGKPETPARAAKAASLMGQTGTVQPAQDEKPWVREKRAPTRAEGVAYMLKITGAKSAKDFMAAWHGTTRT